MALQEHITTRGEISDSPILLPIILGNSSCGFWHMKLNKTISHEVRDNPGIIRPRLQERSPDYECRNPAAVLSELISEPSEVRLMPLRRSEIIPDSRILESIAPAHLSQMLITSWKQKKMPATPAAL